MKNVIISVILFFLFVGPIGIQAQNTPDDQYFHDWSEQWRNAWLNSDFEAIGNFLPEDCHIQWSGNTNLTFTSGSLDKTAYLKWLKDIYKDEYTKVISWTSHGNEGKRNLKIVRSSDKEIVWMTEHYRISEQWKVEDRIKTDSFDLSTHFTFRERAGQWQLVAMFDSYFKINHSSSWATLMQKLAADDWRGKKFKLEAAVKVLTYSEDGRARLWVRVNNADGSNGFFDNMKDRPIRNSEWATYQIEGKIDDNAEYFYFGGLLNVPVVALFDDFKLSIEQQPGQWESVFIPNGDFETEAWKNDQPLGWQGSSVFKLKNFEVKQFGHDPYQGKLALSITGKE